MGLDEYETRTWAGWNHHIALCLLGGAFLLSLQQEWGGKMPQITRPQVYRVVPEMLPREQYGPLELLAWLKHTQECNELVLQRRFLKLVSFVGKISFTMPKVTKLSMVRDDCHEVASRSLSYEPSL